METISLSPQLIKDLQILQQDEIDSYHTYLRLASITPDENNRKLLQKIAHQEIVHYNTWKRYTLVDVQPNWLKVHFYYWIARLFGLTFGVKLMEKSEEKAQDDYRHHLNQIPEIEKVLEEEEVHENQLLNMINEESLRYAGSVVLGLNDALVELTGALAGFTFAFQNTSLIALAALITGISASFSMAASEYLSTKAEAGEQDPRRSALYTGFAYILTVVLLVLPYLLFPNYIVALGVALLIAISIIAVFNYYLSVAKDFPFSKRFLEMTAISLGVATVSFLLGLVVRQAFGIDI
ncbi:MAG: VIT1/CCC1 transporter family protein [Anaerolineales bacterium]|nr:VIT1/CCC1 transporter family protein [Anaerolineales bacterium]MDW8160783.1 VIT1/CCC1 transporter family protein [Anaerolineales bacterium]